MEIVIRNKEGLEFKTELPVEKINEALKYEYENPPDVFWVIFSHIKKFTPSKVIKLFSMSSKNYPQIFIILDTNRGARIEINPHNIILVLKNVVWINRSIKLEDLGI